MPSPMRPGLSDHQMVTRSRNSNVRIWLGPQPETKQTVNKHYAAAQDVLDGKFKGNRKFSDACKAYGLNHKTQIKTVIRRYKEILDCGIEAAGGGRREVCVYTCARVLNVYIANNYIFICA